MKTTRTLTLSALAAALVIASGTQAAGFAPPSDTDADGVISADEMREAREERGARDGKRGGVRDAGNDGRRGSERRV